MKKIISFFFLSIILIIFILLAILSTKGIKTDSFDNLLSNKISQSNDNLEIKLNKIKFKLDISEINLYLETTEPNIVYRNADIPVDNLKVYIDFLSIFKSSPKVKKINLDLKELDVAQLKKISFIIKPSNFKNFLTNNILNGKIFSNIEFYLNKDNQLEDFITKGKVSDLDTKITDRIILKNSNFSFFADNTDVLIKNFYGKFNGVKISEGDIKLNFSKDISLNSNFVSEINFTSNVFKNYSNLIKNNNVLQYGENLIANLNNTVNLKFDKTYKLENFNFKSNGDLKKANFKFKKEIKFDYFKESFKDIYLKDSEIFLNVSSKEKIAKIIGKYSLNNKLFSSFSLNNQNLGNTSIFDVELKFLPKFYLDLINYEKKKGIPADLKLNLIKKDKNLEISELKYQEKNNLIYLKNLKFKKNNFDTFKSLSVKTYLNKKKNNDFNITFEKDLKIKGALFDGTNLNKFFNKNTNKKSNIYINTNLAVELKKIKVPLSESLNDFILIGKIEKGKFSKISAKGDFGKNKFLDISLKARKNNKKYLEIYSDLPGPLLSNFNFFKGLTGGKLLFNSLIDENHSTSNLKIENFKVVDAPGMVKLLSLADLGGLADLAEGEGISFDTLEMNIKNSNGFLKLEEIYAVGPSISVLVEGYKDANGLVSLRGTLVPAKNLNNLISKIPVIGDIIIPKDVGEGLFGISFKMKGMDGNIKTTINPIRTLTPRFIQKIIDKKKAK